MSILNDLGSLSSNLRDYAHATKIFVDGNYELTPKYGFLYYVHIESNIVSADVSNIGMLVKTAQLPKFNVETKKLNSYNKPIFTQTKLNYEPLTITFHDDNSDKVRNFWLSYFKYYYRDTDNTDLQFAAMVNAKYDQDRQFSNWGYTPEGIHPFLKKITIFSLHQKKYSSYALMNPVIKSFQHGEHSYGANETMTNSMTLEYESVLYSHGKVTESKVPGFLTRYDLHPSPITPAGGGTESILGVGGILDTAGDIGTDIEEGNFGAALFKGIQGVKNIGNMDLTKAATGELLDLGKDILRGNNSSNNIFIPSVTDITASAKSWIGGGISNVFKKKKEQRVNEEVSNATFGALTSTSGISGLSFGFGLFSAMATSAEATSSAVQSELNTSMDLKSKLANETLLDQTSQIKKPTNQVVVNESQLLSTLQYNRSIAQQNKIDLQVEVQKLKDQQQMITDAIVSLTAKRNSLLISNLNELLVKQLTLQIEQQYLAISENELIISNSNDQIDQLDKKITLINAKITGLT